MCPRTPTIHLPRDMALQLNVLKTRSLTALLFVAVMALGLFFSASSYALLFLLLLLVGWIEYAALIDRIHARQTHVYVTMGWILNGLSVCLLFSKSSFLLGDFSLKNNLLLPLHMAGVILLIGGTFISKSLSFRHWIALAAGNVYITLPFAWAQDLYGCGPFPDAALVSLSPVWWTVVCIATMWTNDTMAYLLGSLIGRTPFSKISPKKTWEGTLSGIICATVLIGWILDRCLYDEVFHPVTGYLLIFLLAVAGTIGDLFESKLKRLAGVKDSGQLMPGHGGVLDRFDSFLFAIPVLYLFLRAVSLSY